MLKIRLTRIGAKKRPFYRVIVKEERSKRDGDYLELLGTYNPLTEPKEIKLKQDRIDHWVKQGAQMSIGFLRIIGKAPQRPPRKPKKERQQATVDSGQAVAAEQPKAEEQAQSATEQPTEQPVTEQVTEETKVDETVIASETKQSTQDENPTQIATEPEAPRDDKKEESETKDERPS